MRSLRHDLTAAVRSLAAAPLTAAAALLLIALGVGANLAVFAVSWGVLLEPLPYADPSRLAIVSVSTADGSDFGMPAREIDGWADALRTVEGAAGFTTSEVAVTGAGEPRRVRAATVSAGLFELLGTAPAAGRLDGLGGSAPVAVVSRRLARQLAAGLAGAQAAENAADAWRSTVGAAVTAAGRPVTVAAVLPADFAFPDEGVDLWLPITDADHGIVGTAAKKYRLIVRLAAGATPRQLEEDTVRVLAQLRGEEAVAPGRGLPTVILLDDATTGGLRPVLAASLVAAALVLLVTCANVAMLLLGRAALRRRETAVRLALGAGRWRLLRGSLIESLLLAAGGAVGGVALAHLALRLFTATAAGVIPRAGAVGLAPPVLAAAVGLVLLVALLCGITPALSAARRDVAAVLRGSAAGRRGQRSLALLVVGQVAASVVLLTGAALLSRTVLELMADDGGIAPAGVLIAELPLGGEGSAGAGSGPGGSATAAPPGFVPEAVERIRALPGVAAAGIGSGLPPTRQPFQIFIRWLADGRNEGLTMSAVAATPGFLDALGVRPLAGRTFSEQDERFAAPVVLLSESAARFVAPESDGGRGLVGRELPWRLPPIARFESQPRVIGIVGDLKYAGLDQPPAAAVYLPWYASPSATGYLAVRTAGGAPTALAGPLRSTLRELAPALPLPAIRPLRSEMARSIADRRLRAIPAIGFAAVALAVALIGVFALFNRAAAERRRELAIRLALGASRGGVRRLMLRRAALLAGAGIALGLAATAALVGGLKSLLYGVTPHDPATVAAVLLVTAAAALAAAYLPARRAAAVEPAELLRAE